LFATAALLIVGLLSSHPDYRRPVVSGFRDAPGRLDPSDSGHPDIHQRQVRPQDGNKRFALLAGRRLADALEAARDVNHFSRQPEEGCVVVHGQEFNTGPARADVLRVHERVRQVLRRPAPCVIRDAMHRARTEWSPRPAHV
jgi:hypothetical protein